jgi:hypothetical protein
MLLCNSGVWTVYEWGKGHALLLLLNKHPDVLPGRFS